MHIVPVTRISITAILIAAIGYLGVVAMWPTVPDSMPSWFAWFGQPRSWASALTVVALFCLILYLRWYPKRDWPRATATRTIAALAIASFYLGVMSYWRHSGDRTPGLWPIVAALSGSSAEPSGANPTIPLALDIAQLTAVAVVLGAVFAAAVKIFHDAVDRVRIWRAGRITAVVGIEDDCIPLFDTIADAAAGSTLVVVTASPDRECIRHARSKGAHIVESSLTAGDGFGQLSFWPKLHRLYLLSDAAQLNLERAEAIASVRAGKPSVQLTVRIDDPWQAEIWRRRHSATDWDVDAIGIHQTTASHLLTGTAGLLSDQHWPTEVFLTGTTLLDIAICSELAWHARVGSLIGDASNPMPRCFVIDPTAGAFVSDHELRQRRLTPNASPLDLIPSIRAVTIDEVSKLVDAETTSRAAIVLTGSDTSTFGSRLATRFPDALVYLCPPGPATSTETTAIGNVVTVPPTLGKDDGWERAVQQIHKLYSHGRVPSPSTRPWHQLDEVYKVDSRRALANILRLIESEGDSSWDSLTIADLPPLPADFTDLCVSDQARALGFSPEAFEAMMAAEHDDWVRFRRQHPHTHTDRSKLIEWTALDEEARVSSLRYFASQLITLRSLGYCSVPNTHEYSRRGVVTGRQLTTEHVWTNHNDEPMTALPGDWLVSDPTGGERSVAASEFENLYEPTGLPSQFTRRGTVRARRALPGETVTSLEGPTTAKLGDYLVQSPTLERDQWFVPESSFHPVHGGYVRATTAATHLTGISASPSGRSTAARH